MTNQALDQSPIKRPGLRLKLGNVYDLERWWNSQFLCSSQMDIRSCHPVPCTARPRTSPAVNTKPCLLPRLSQTSKLATHQQMIVGEHWEAALTITAQRGLSPFLCLHSAHAVHTSFIGSLSSRREGAGREAGSGRGWGRGLWKSNGASDFSPVW